MLAKNILIFELICGGAPKSESPLKTNEGDIFPVIYTESKSDILTKKYNDQLRRGCKILRLRLEKEN